MPGLRWTEEQLDAFVRVGRRQNKGRRTETELRSKLPKTKYRNEKTARDGVVYDSKHESKVLADLETLERAGHIRDLRRQVKFAIVIGDIHVCDYIADAVYMEGKRRVVVDAKSAATRKLPVYRLKRKLMAAVLGIEVEER